MQSAICFRRCADPVPFHVVPSFAEVSDVSFSFGAGVAIGRAWVWSSNIFKFTVKIFTRPFKLLLKIYDLLKLEIKTTGNGYIIPPMDKENRLWLGICDGFPGGSLTRKLLKKMPKGMA